MLVVKQFCACEAPRQSLDHGHLRQRDRQQSSGLILSSRRGSFLQLCVPVSDEDYWCRTLSDRVHHEEFPVARYIITVGRDGVANTSGEKSFWCTDLYRVAIRLDINAGHLIGAVQVEQDLAVLAPYGLRAAPLRHLIFRSRMREACQVYLRAAGLVRLVGEPIVPGRYEARIAIASNHLEDSKRTDILHQRERLNGGVGYARVSLSFFVEQPPSIGGGVDGKDVVIRLDQGLLGLRAVCLHRTQYLVITILERIKEDRSSIGRPNWGVHIVCVGGQWRAGPTFQVPHPKRRCAALIHHISGNAGALRRNASGAIDRRIGELCELLAGRIEPNMAIAGRAGALLIEKYALRGNGKDRHGGDVVGSDLVGERDRLCRNFSVAGIEFPRLQRSVAVGEQPAGCVLERIEASAEEQ